MTSIIIVVLSLITTFLLSQVGHFCQIEFIRNIALFLRVLIHFGLFLGWIFSIRQRIIQEKVRIYLLVIGSLIVFWIFVRTNKYYFLPKDSTMSFLMWYAYYIPMLCIPILNIFIALSLGKPADYSLPRKIYFLCVPTLVMIGLVLTNNLHQHVFIFNSQPWSGGDYSYGIGYWIVYAWMIGTLLLGIVMILSKSRVPRSRRILWLPFVPMLALVVQGIANMMRVPIVGTLANDITLFFSLLIVLTLESCIQIGLIKSNKNYEQLFFSSGIAAWIFNKHGEAQYFTEEAEDLPMVSDENTRLSKAKISGGNVLWLEDISTMNKLLLELKDVGDHLSERNTLLKAEIELKERVAKLEEKNRLYDRLKSDVSKQLQILDDLLNQEENTVEIKEKLTWLCVLGAYIKRRSNLTILGEENAFLSAKELEYCFQETSEAISACGITCYFNRQCQGIISTERALLVYDLLEEIAEKALVSLKDLFINLKIIDGKVDLKIQLSGVKDKLALESPLIKQVVEDDTLHLTLEIDKGAGRE